MQQEIYLFMGVFGSSKGDGGSWVCQDWFV